MSNFTDEEVRHLVYDIGNTRKLGVCSSAILVDLLTELLELRAYRNAPARELEPMPLPPRTCQ